jgi:uncharacterized protein YaaN involved in tellurite resistance
MGDDLFSLTAPSQEASKTEEKNSLALPAELKGPLKEKAEWLIAKALECADSSDAAAAFQKEADSFGLENLRAAANRNKFLSVSVAQLASSADEGGPVAKSFSDLQEEISSLDPKNADFSKRGFFGLSNPIKSYFSKYPKSEARITDILQSLERSKSSLRNDSITLDLEQKRVKEQAQKIKDDAMALLYARNKVEESLEKIKADPEKKEGAARAGDALFSLNQRLMDLQQAIAVSNQGILAMEIVQKNNAELIKGIDRAQTVTVMALRTSVMVAGALYNQKLSLKKLDALNVKSESALKGVSGMLEGSGFKKGQPPSMEALRSSFDEVNKALDDLKSYKEKAAPEIQVTLSKFSELSQSETMER